MNEASILINENEYSFLSTGHLYGAPQNIHSNHPSSSALGSIEKLNSFSSKFMVLCGDIFKSTDQILFQNFLNGFASKLNFPIYNAVGNHDVSNRKLYNEYFGKTFFDFRYNSEKFIILDTELKDQLIVQEQLDYIENLFNNISSDSSIKKYIYFHTQINMVTALSSI